MYLNKDSIEYPADQKDTAAEWLKKEWNQDAFKKIQIIEQSLRDLYFTEIDWLIMPNNKHFDKKGQPIGAGFTHCHKQAVTTEFRELLSMWESHMECHILFYGDYWTAQLNKFIKTQIKAIRDQWDKIYTICHSPFTHREHKALLKPYGFKFDNDFTSFFNSSPRSLEPMINDWKRILTDHYFPKQDDQPKTEDKHNEQ